MLVANSFDLWQKDVFFAAAEEVQQSADIMESAYRTWLGARRERLMPQYLDELGRQLQMALSTAKWQLEEFEKAVRMSYRGNGDDITVSRHRDFVSALEEQISNVETALEEAFELDGKKQLRWVHLDEEECDDLARFLSGVSGTSQRVTDEGISCGTLCNQDRNEEEDSNKGKCLEEVVTGNDDSKYFIGQEKSRFMEKGAEISYEADNLRDWNSRDMLLEIVIDKDDRHKNAGIEATPKEKGYKPGFWSLRAKGVSSHAHMKVVNWINQFLRGNRNQRQQHASPVSSVKSLRFILALMLTVFFVVPFLVYST